jgi:hypothetical protein
MNSRTNLESEKPLEVAVDPGLSSGTKEEIYVNQRETNNDDDR